MIRSFSVLRDASAAAVVVFLALTVGLSAAVPASADDGDPGPSCGVGIVCELLPGDQKPPPDTPGTGKPTGPPSEPPAPPPAAPPPAPTLPAVPVAPAPAPVPVVTTDPGGGEVEEIPTPEATASTVSPAATSAGPSAESNWNKPVTKSAKPTQAAAVSRNDGSGLFGGPGLLAIMAGVLLVGAAGLAFAWWGRNRFSSH
jgi:outer membrane biosynthesis protein TonB